MTTVPPMLEVREFDRKTDYMGVLVPLSEMTSPHGPRGRSGVTATQLARSCSEHPASVYRTCGPLADWGLVQPRFRNSGPSEQIHWLLTRGGEKLVNIYELHEETDMQLLRCFPEAFAATASTEELKQTGQSISDIYANCTSLVFCGLLEAVPTVSPPTIESASWTLTKAGLASVRIFDS